MTSPSVNLAVYTKQKRRQQRRKTICWCQSDTCAPSPRAQPKKKKKSEIITLIALAQLRQHHFKFLLCAYCFENGGARTSKPWSWFRSDESVARKIWGGDATRRATQNTDPGETWRRSRAGGFWCNPEEHPVRVAAVLLSPGSRCKQTHGDPRLRALAPEKRSLCATTRQSGAPSRAICTNILISDSQLVYLMRSLPEDGSVS